MGTQPKTGLPRYYSVTNAEARHMIDETETKTHEEIPRLGVKTSPQKGDEARSENAPSSVSKAAPVRAESERERRDNWQHVLAEKIETGKLDRIAGVAICLTLAALCTALRLAIPDTAEDAGYKQAWLSFGSGLFVWFGFIAATKPKDLGARSWGAVQAYGATLPPAAFGIYGLYQFASIKDPRLIIVGVLATLPCWSWVASYWVKKGSRLRTFLQVTPTLLVGIAGLYETMSPHNRGHENPIGVIVLCFVVWLFGWAFLDQDDRDFDDGWDILLGRKKQEAAPPQPTLAHSQYADESQGHITGLEEKEP